MTTTTSITLDLTGDVFDRIVGAVVDFSTLDTFNLPHHGGVPWQEFVKIHTTGTSVYAIAGDGVSLAVARNARKTAPMEFLIHAPDARELLAIDFERIEFTPHGDMLEVTVWRNRRPWLLELDTRPTDAFPSMQSAAATALASRGAAQTGLSARTLERLHGSAKRFGPNAGLTIYPRDDAGAPVVAAYRDELLLVAQTSATSELVTELRPGYRGQGTALGARRRCDVDPLDFWPDEIAGGAW